MKQSDRINEAMESFLQRLPDPNRSNSSTIIREVTIMGKKIKFRAQKSKGRTGITWHVDYGEEGAMT